MLKKYYCKRNSTSVNCRHFSQKNGFISFTFPISIFVFLSRQRRKCPRRDTAIRVLQMKGFQVTETSRSSYHLNELRAALKMKGWYGKDRGKGERLIGGSTKERITRRGGDATRQPEYGWKTGKDARKRKDGLPSDRRDGGPENRETIQSAADAANCPLIIRTKVGWGWKTRGGGGWSRSRGAGCTTPSFSFSSDEGRRMKYSTLIRCNCDVVLENSPRPALPASFPLSLSSQLLLVFLVSSFSVSLFSMFLHFDFFKCGLDVWIIPYSISQHFFSLITEKDNEKEKILLR